jgi:AraC family transcriptional regulator
MDSRSLLIKNMVCHRCVNAVEQILRENKIDYEDIQIGEVHLKKAIDQSLKKTLRSALEHIGLNLIDDRTAALVEKIKILVTAKARNETGEGEKKLKLSSYLSSALNQEYTYISALFSSLEGRTIETYFIQQRIEKAKELLVYGQMNLSEIAYELDYSSVAHLSAQFKKITGLTPSHFRKIGEKKREAIDLV